jgi:uncharacterized protein YkwD
MFCALNGATAMPRRANTRHNPVTMSDLPASEDVPAIRTPLDAPVSELLVSELLAQFRGSHLSTLSLPTGAVYGVSAERSCACRMGIGYVWLYLCRYQIVTCSGVVVRDGGTVTGIALRIASASAAVLVSAAVAGAALYGGTALSDPREPNGDDRLIAVPAAPSSSPSETPSSLSTETPLPSRKATPSGDSLAQRARAHSRTHKCNIHQTGSACYRPLKSHAAATRSKGSTTTKRRSPIASPSHSAKPTKKPTQSPKSTPSKSASSASGYDTRSDWADAVLDELNDERADHGLPGLKLNSKLVSSAHTHNLAMAKANTLSHQLGGEAALGSRVSAAGYQWSMVGENIAYNSDRSGGGVLAVQKAMYNEKPPDDGHRKNILNKKFDDVGIDVINDSVHGRVWLVTDFGRS